MPYPVDPASLEGDELDRWYRRSPLDIERERQAAADEKWQAYFAPRPQAAEPSEPNPTSSPGDDDLLWVANGSGGFRVVRPRTPDYVAALRPPAARPDDLPLNPAAPEEGNLVEVGNPYNRILKKQWEAVNGRLWPKTPDGRSYHVSHKRAIADGGDNTLDNIEPMHPDEHPAMHQNNGDSARWAKRQSIARAFGGRVEPPSPRPPMRPAAPRVAVEPISPRAGVSGIGGAGALGILGLGSDILGIISGRIPPITSDSWRADEAYRDNGLIV